MGKAKHLGHMPNRKRNGAFFRMRWFMKRAGREGLLCCVFSEPLPPRR